MKRHFNMAPLYSDRRIVELARGMEDMYASEARIELGIGWVRLERLIEEYGLVFKKKPKGEQRKYNPRPLKTEQDKLNAGFSVRKDGKWIKHCSLCKEIKTVDKFYEDSEKTSGYRSRCIECERQYQKRYYAANKPNLPSR